MREVFLITEGRGHAPGRMPHIRANPGESLTHVEFPVLPNDGYVRLEFINHEGKKAFTRAYFIDELLE